MSKKAASKLCHECKEKLFCYQCPRCSFRSCSLACCLAHKKRLNCSGKRNRSEFQLVRDMTDSTLESDYHFLEDVLRNVESSKRVLPQKKGNISKKPKREETATEGPHSLLEDSATDIISSNLNDSEKKRIPPRLRKFHSRAIEGGVAKIHYMPQGMSRNTMNKCHIRRQKAGETLYWSVEWNIQEEDSSKPTVKLATVAETAALRTVCGALESKIENMALLIKQRRPDWSDDKYVQLNIDGTLKEALEGLTLIEFPTIKVIPEQRLQEYPVMMQVVSSSE